MTVIVGQVFGRLTVVGFGRSGRYVLADCQCACGAPKSVRTGSLTAGYTRSCGCLQKEVAAARQLRHGATHAGRLTTEWVTWRSMRQRCEDPNHKSFARYGGRGIRVCARWQTFENFLADMGPKPPGLQLEREDNDRGYEPGNCVWATRSEQAKNRRARERDLRGRFAGSLEEMS